MYTYQMCVLKAIYVSCVQGDACHCCKMRDEALETEMNCKN